MPPMIDITLALLLVVVLYLVWVQWRRAPGPLPEPAEQAAAAGPASTYYWKLTRQTGFSPERMWPVYLGAKVLLAVVLPLAVMEWIRPGWWLPLGLVFVGFFLPDAVLHYLRLRRQDDIRRSLSFFLDLFVSLLQAGLSLEEAFARAAREGLRKGHPLAEEALLVVGELDLGRDRTLGFQALAERTGVKELRALASALGVGLGVGASVEATLRAQADLMRAKRREDGLKRLEIASAEVLLPLLLCSFPVFVVLILVPLVLVVIDSLKAFGQVVR
jgi:pilus assembly protein TadC